jgi:hypothetical protein
MLAKFVDVKIFLVTLIIALVGVYIYQPEAKVVYRFPNPDNSGKLTYKDAGSEDSCYKYEATEVKCPSDPNLILEHPVIIH